MRRSLAAAAAITAALAAIGWTIEPYLERVSFPVCFFLAATARPCMFCGMTHAVAYAMHGEWDRAAAANPAWWLILPLFVGITAGIVSGRFRVGWGVVGLVVGGSVARAWL